MPKCVIVLVFPVLLFVSLGVSIRQPLAGGRKLSLRPGLSPSDRVTVNLNQVSLAQALIMYSELTGRKQLPKTSPISQELDEIFGGYPSHWHLLKVPPQIRSGIEYHRDGLFSVAEVKERLEERFASMGLVLLPDGNKYFRVTEQTKTGKRQVN